MPTKTTDSPEVVRWYTRARRFPQLIGKTPTGGSIWGGPYTFTQVGVGVGAIVIGVQTTWLWGHFGLLGNVVILLGVAYGLVVLVGKLPIGSRNPLSMAAGALKAFSAPAQGNLGGVPLRIRRPHHARSRLIITTNTPTLDDIEVPQTTRRTPASAAEELLPEPAKAEVSTRLRPTRASVRTSPSPTPALTGVQRLLASSTSIPRQED